MNEKKRTWKKKLAIIVLAILAIIIVPLLVVTALEIYSIYKPTMKPIRYTAEDIDYWPSKGWRLSTPEKQGIDSEKLLEMADFNRKTHSENKRIIIDSVTVIRNGYIVSEMYFNPLFPKDTKHIIHSITKSVMATLIGIAIDKGYIQSVEVPVISFFDDKKIENADQRWKRLTIKHLLTMQTGLKSRDSYLYRYEGLSAMQKTDDWMEYILKLPFEVEPGTRFEYSNMATFVLGAILHKATGEDVLQFARKNLFIPLGIKDVQWEKSPKGIAKAWARMWLKPHDLAKIGQLYLQKGYWDGRQIVSSTWIDDTLTAYGSPNKYRKVYDKNGEWDIGTSGQDWVNSFFFKAFTDGYGYQWWLDKSGIFSAVGTGGQYMTVVPEKKLIVVITSKLSGLDVVYPTKLFEKFILPSIVSNKALPPNLETQKKLSLLSKAPDFENKGKTTAEIPITAYEISAKTFKLETNYFKYDNLKIEFKKGRAFAKVSYNAKEGDYISYRVGLDRTYRLTESNETTYASLGHWKNDTTFIIETEIVGYSSKDKWILTFEDEAVSVEDIGVVGVQKYKGKVHK